MSMITNCYFFLFDSFFVFKTITFFKNGLIENLITRLLTKNIPNISIKLQKIKEIIKQKNYLDLKVNL